MRTIAMLGTIGMGVAPVLTLVPRIRETGGSATATATGESPEISIRGRGRGRGRLFPSPDLWIRVGRFIERELQMTQRRTAWRTRLSSAPARSGGAAHCITDWPAPGPWKSCPAPPAQDFHPWKSLHGAPDPPATRGTSAAAPGRRCHPVEADPAPAAGPHFAGKPARPHRGWPPSTGNRVRGRPMAPCCRWKLGSRFARRRCGWARWPPDPAPLVPRVDITTRILAVAAAARGSLAPRCAAASSTLSGPGGFRHVTVATAFRVLICLRAWVFAPQNRPLRCSFPLTAP